jgi:tryptophanyl-tRNA synthetase
MRLVSHYDVVAQFETDYENCTIRYGEMKKQLAEDIAIFIKPIREKAKAIENDKVYLTNVIRKVKKKQELMLLQ